MYNRGGDRMKIYDTHSDIMFNLYNRTMNGEKDVFAKYHLDDLKKGGIAGGIWVIYSETDFDIQQFQQNTFPTFIHIFRQPRPGKQKPPTHCGRAVAF